MRRFLLAAALLVGCKGTPPVELLATRVAQPTQRHHAPVVANVGEYFATLDQRFDARAARGVHAVYKFELGRGDEYEVVVDDGRMSVVRGAPRPASATLIMKGEDYVAMANGKIDGTMAFLKGDLKIQGDLGAAQRMAKLFPPSTN
jgi:putative sterol carrier protein